MTTKFFFPLWLLLFLHAFTITRAQSFTLYGDRAWGGTDYEQDVHIIAVNNGFILFGSSISDISGDKTDSLCGSFPFREDSWVIKISTSLNTVWNKSIGGSETDNQPRPLVTGDNRIMFSASSESDSSCEKSENNRSFPNNKDDYWICEIDSNGSLIWDKTIGGSEVDDYPQIVQLSTGGYIVCGKSVSPKGADKTIGNYGSFDYWAVKLHNNGNKLWDKVYGGTGQEITSSGNGNYFSLLADEEGGFVLAGTTESPASGNISDAGFGFQDIWIIKLDSGGNKIWDKRYGGSVHEACNHIIHTNDNGYILCGETNSPQDGEVSGFPRGMNDFWVIKLDSSGNKQWDKRYGGNNNDGAAFIEEAPGGGYWVSGFTASDSTYEVSEPTYGSSDYWILKIDNAGNKLWDKRFGAAGDDRGSDFIIMPDTSIYFCGSAGEGTSAVKTDSGKGSWDYWVVHFKYGGIGIGVNDAPIINNLITVYPNPATETIAITSEQEFTSLRITNILGEEVLHQTFSPKKEMEINVSPLPAGIYFLQAEVDGIMQVKKFVKE